MVGMAALSPSRISTRPTGTGYTKAITVSIPPRVVSHLFSLDYIGTDDLLAAHGSLHDRWRPGRLRCRGKNAHLDLSSWSAMPPIGRHRQSSRMLSLNPVSLRPVGPLPLPLVYPSPVAQMVSYRRILRSRLSFPVLWSLCRDRRLAVEAPRGFHLNRGTRTSSSGIETA